MFVVLLQLILIKPLERWMPKNLKEKLIERKKKLFFGTIVRLVVPGFFVIYPSIIFNFQNPLFTTSGEVFGFILNCCWSMIVFGLMPALLIYTISVPK